MSSAKQGDVGKAVSGKSKSMGASAAAVDAQLRTKVILNPDTASCEGNSTICLIFDDERPGPLIGVSGRVEVCVHTNEKCDRIVATQVNERTFQFLAPNNREGDASVVVFVNGTEVASSYLRYRPSDTVYLVDGLSQIYLHFLSTVCRYMYALETKHQIPRAMHELDRLLAESFDDKDNKHNIPPKAFEELFDILRHSSTDVVQSEHELPTLLHLSGVYGLNQLAERLLDLPEATRSSNIFNRDGKTASELACSNGYPQLVKIFSASKKVNSDLVDVKNPSNILKGEDGDYMLLSNATSATDFKNDRRILPQRQLSFEAANSGKAQKPPPAPCQKFLEYKMLTDRIPDSQLPTLPAHSSVETAAPPGPPGPQRDSRDSGVNIDGNDALPGPLSTPIRKRPPLLRGLTEPALVLSNEEEGHCVASNRRGSQDTTAGKTVQRNHSVSGKEIGRQLKKPVHPQPGTKGSSVTK